MYHDCRCVTITITVAYVLRVLWRNEHNNNNDNVIMCTCSTWMNANHTIINIVVFDCTYSSTNECESYELYTVNRQPSCDLTYNAIFFNRKRYFDLTFCTVYNLVAGDQNVRVKRDRKVKLFSSTLNLFLIFFLVYSSSTKHNSI